ncbi:MAG: fumarylacetoacetate hydrolase family protein [Hyphomicrobiaceae bacterium]|nr:fumarylacetoacetate hydrolase family protein [Hyphomicrobiaceae bacterium]
MVDRTAMDYVIPPSPRPTLPVAGSDLLFPVRRVYCIGRNYAEHAREMGHDPDREPPFFFQKSPENLIADGVFPFPAHSSDVQFEVEMAVFLKSGGVDIDAARALDHVFGYGVALDMTRRDLQGEAKKLGRPWEVGKAFEHSAPCSPVWPAAQTGHPSAGEIWLDQNGTRRQTGDLQQMIWGVGEQIAVLSRYFKLGGGDVILTGTPAGVGRVARGDELDAGVAGVGQLHVTVA